MTADPSAIADVREPARRADKLSMLDEHSMVRSLETISDGTVSVPKGTIGTVVYVHERDVAYEVEFDAPHHAVLSVRRRQIQAA